MKHLRIYFSAMAFILAIGGAFASKSFTDVIGYKRLASPFRVSQPTECENVKLCNQIGTIRCEDDNDGTDLWKAGSSGTGTNCDTAVFHDPDAD